MCCESFQDPSDLSCDPFSGPDPPWLSYCHFLLIRGQRTTTCVQFCHFSLLQPLASVSRPYCSPATIPRATASHSCSQRRPGVRPPFSGGPAPFAPRGRWNVSWSASIRPSTCERCPPSPSRGSSATGEIRKSGFSPLVVALRSKNSGCNNFPWFTIDSIKRRGGRFLLCINRTSEIFPCGRLKHFSLHVSRGFIQI